MKTLSVRKTLSTRASAAEAYAIHEKAQLAKSGTFVVKYPVKYTDHNPEYDLTLKAGDKVCISGNTICDASAKRIKFVISNQEKLLLLDLVEQPSGLRKPKQFSNSAADNALIDRMTAKMNNANVARSIRAAR